MKYIYKITYPTGKIYIGKDLTGSVNYYGSADSTYIQNDFPSYLINYFSIKKEILWKSENASDQEVNKKEIEYIEKFHSNNPLFGYNQWPEDKSIEIPAISDIEYIEGIRFNLDDLINLYKDEGWINYYENIEAIKKAFSNSLCIVGAYKENKLIGFCRCVGDGEFVLLIQDVIIHNDYKRKGIGKYLIEYVDNKYKNVRQKIIICDNTKELNSFYEKLGYRIIQDYQMNCFYKEN